MKPNLSSWELNALTEKSDLLIIGSGFTALWSALHFKERFPEKNVKIIEKESFSRGASTKNAGFACFGSPSEILADLKVKDESKVLNLIEKRLKGIEMIKHYFKAASINYEQKGGVELFREEDKNLFRAVSKKIGYLNEKIGVITGKLETFSEANLASNFEESAVIGCYKNNIEGQLNPLKLLMALKEKALSGGVLIFNGIEALNINSKEGLVQTEIAELKADHILLANNAFTYSLIPDLKIKPCRAQVLITDSREEGFQLPGSFHVKEGFYYFRDWNNALLIGGGRNIDLKKENTGEFGLNPKIQSHLLEMVNKLFPDHGFNVARRWSGIMGFSDNKEPGIHYLNKKLSFVGGHSGMGVALAPVLAKDWAKGLEVPE